MAGTENTNIIDITRDKDGGVLKEILREGEPGESPLAGEKCWVHYEGKLLDGREFDSSRKRNEKFTFDLGKGNVIKAWDLGVATMKKGELARLTCKPEYAYGEEGSPPTIPPNATLIFEVELFDWEGEDLSEDKDKGIIRHQIIKGSGWKSPSDGSDVEVKFIGRCNGEVFQEKECQFTMGEADDDIIAGIEVALKKFKKGEKSKLTIAPKYAFGPRGKPEWNITPDSTVEYELELKNFEKCKESWEMNAAEKLEQSEIKKSKGTTFFKAQRYKHAIHQYKQIITYLEHETSLKDEEEKHRNNLMLSARLNLAMCYLKSENWLEAEEECNKALELDDRNEKAYFRRGQARFERNDFDTAVEDFKHVLDIDANNKAAKQRLLLCNQKLKLFHDKQKNIYKGMFEKFAEKDSKLKTKYTWQGEYNIHDPIGEWNNDMARGMMTLEQECEAFGERMPEKGDNHHGMEEANDD
ncbi:hypothetical protein ScPMuIL_016662 [Solemya velum]